MTRFFALLSIIVGTTMAAWTPTTASSSFTASDGSVTPFFGAWSLVYGSKEPTEAVPMTGTAISISAAANFLAGAPLSGNPCYPSEWQDISLTTGAFCIDDVYSTLICTGFPAKFEQTAIDAWWQDRSTGLGCKAILWINYENYFDCMLNWRAKFWDTNPVPDMDVVLIQGAGDGLDANGDIETDAAKINVLLIVFGFVPLLSDSLNTTWSVSVTPDPTPYEGFRKGGKWFFFLMAAVFFAMAGYSCFVLAKLANKKTVGTFVILIQGIGASILYGYRALYEPMFVGGAYLFGGGFSNPEAFPFEIYDQPCSTSTTLLMALVWARMVLGITNEKFLLAFNAFSLLACFGVFCYLIYPPLYLGVFYYEVTGVPFVLDEAKQAAMWPTIWINLACTVSFIILGVVFVIKLSLIAKNSQSANLAAAGKKMLKWVALQSIVGGCLLLCNFHMNSPVNYRTLTVGRSSFVITVTQPLLLANTFIQVQAFAGSSSSSSSSSSTSSSS